MASSEDKTFSYIPDCSDLPISEDADYVYICENNTIYGTKYKELPNTKERPWLPMYHPVSCQSLDVTRYGLICGGVQKNIGPAGTVIVIIREDLITEDACFRGRLPCSSIRPMQMPSLFTATPPAYGIYICGKVFKWLKRQGGLCGNERAQ